VTSTPLVGFRPAIAMRMRELATAAFATTFYNTLAQRKLGKSQIEIYTLRCRMLHCAWSSSLQLDRFFSVLASGRSF
jgi:hypothetical protein